MPFGTFTYHGTMFVGFCADQARLQKMLESMAGLIGGQRDSLTNYTRPVTGAYYFVPAVESLAPPDENWQRKLVPQPSIFTPQRDDDTEAHADNGLR